MCLVDPHLLHHLAILLLDEVLVRALCLVNLLLRSLIARWEH